MIAEMKAIAWWEHPHLHFERGRLQLDGRDLITLAQASGTPAYFYSGARILNNLQRLHDALEAVAVPHQIFYALKANRFQPIPTMLKLAGLCGVDVCSPNELLLARQVGFAEEEISLTATSVSNADLAIYARHPRIEINCDSISTIERLGKISPGRTIGLRINPQAGAGYNEDLEYAGKSATKFGIYGDRFEEALAMAERYDLRVTRLHAHFGSGYLTHHLDKVDAALRNCTDFLDHCPTIETLDIGGGLGVPLVAGDGVLDLDAWAEIIASYARPRGLTIQIEPGDYLVKDAGVLVVEVNSVEEKGGTIFVGINAGLNVNNTYAYYRTPFVIAPLRWDEMTTSEMYSIAGNINESIDILADNIVLPRMQEGDLLALINVGGYGASSSSNHCMRGSFQEYFLPTM